MNEDKIKGQWKQLAGRVKAKWGKLTDDDLKVAGATASTSQGKFRNVTVSRATRRKNR